MNERSLPSGLVPPRRTPVFDYTPLPPALVKSHHAVVWAELRVQTDSVRYADLEGELPRDEQLEAGDTTVVEPGVEHRGRDLDTREEIFEMVTRQYADITQDGLIETDLNCPSCFNPVLDALSANVGSVVR